MEYGGHSDSGGARTFREHWGALVVSACAAGVAQAGFFAYSFFRTVEDTAWAGWFAAALGVALAGAGMILAAKLPLYRSGRWLTFGGRAIPAGRRGIYRAGYGCVLAAGMVMLFLTR